MKMSDAVKGFLLDREVDGYSPNILEIYRWALELIVEFTDDIPGERIGE